MSSSKMTSRMKLSALCLLIASATYISPVYAEAKSDDIYVTSYEEDAAEAKEAVKSVVRNGEVLVYSNADEKNTSEENSAQEKKQEKESALKTGIVLEDGVLRLYDEEGKLRKDNKWVEHEGKFYFPNAEGKLYNKQFIHFGAISYYMDEDGSRAYGRREYNGKLYYLDAETGILHKDNAWVLTNEGWIFPNADGHVYRNQFISFGPKISYYVGSNGVPVKGVIEANGSVYRMTGEAGARLVEAGPYTYNGKHYYADANGHPVRNAEISIDGKNYYYGADGSRVFEDLETDSHIISVNSESGVIVNKEEKQKSKGADAPMLYSLRDLRFHGVIRWSGYKFTYYSQSVLPGGGLRIPGRHVNESGYVADEDGYIVLANSAPRGTVIPTPFGYYGKVYDRGTSGNHFDVYTK